MAWRVFRKKREGRAERTGGYLVLTSFVTPEVGCAAKEKKKKRRLKRYVKRKKKKRRRPLGPLTSLPFYPVREEEEKNQQLSHHMPGKGKE